MNIQKFRKGFTDARTHEMFLKSVHEGDAEQICAVLHGIGLERTPVDAMINATPRAMRVNQQAANATFARPEFGSSEYMDELNLVKELALARDTPMEELPKHMPRPLREQSIFLADTFVRSAEPGVDYGITQADFKFIQEAKIPAPYPPSNAPDTLIKTGRDAATFVHTDNPITPWFDAVDKIFAESIQPAMPERMQTSYPAQSNFMVYGKPFFYALLGMALFEAGLVSFHRKWRDCQARPEESAPVLTGEFLPLAYPEGSPLHPTDPAMHSMAALVAAYLLKLFFDANARIQGLNLHDQLDLMADNIGYYRLHAGVHFESDHKSARVSAEVVANTIAQRFL